ncbi:MAG: hypothetical protein MHM6MM_005543 [Cercozoa sp. M6MM]
MGLNTQCDFPARFGSPSEGVRDCSVPGSLLECSMTGGPDGRRRVTRVCNQQQKCEEIALCS